MTGRAGRPARGAAGRPQEGLSWFGPSGAGVDDDAAPLALDQDEWPASEVADSPWLSSQARRMADAGLSGLQRLYRDFVAARAALSVALLATEMIATGFGSRTRDDLALGLCAFYAISAILLWLRPPTVGRVRVGRGHLGRGQWLLTIGADVLMFASLQSVAGGSGLNYAALMVLPALMAGALTPRVQALGVAAACSLVLLGAAWAGREAVGSAPLLMTQAGLAGSGLFAVALLAGGLSLRLASEERSARGSLDMARRQAQLNRLVLEEMQDGVLVVDRLGRVRAANPAARAVLGELDVSEGDSFALTGVAGWEPLVGVIDRAFSGGAWPEGGCDVTLPAAPSVTASGAARPAHHLRVRGRFTQSRGGRHAKDYCVLFLEDLRAVQARMRQEKLAAMGRVSAGIAHEIRNPLAAIMQANALLAEDAASAEQRQLTRMVADNAERLKRIVDDVMEVVPGPTPQTAVLDATAQTAAICSEWSRTAAVPPGPGSPLQVILPSEPLGVMFDGEHLRRVLVNLLDNAILHSSGRPGAVRLELCSSGDRRALLTVASDGPPIAPEVERYLFEPFFSTRSRGTGLGLYISRELCERYGATIEYRAVAGDHRHGNEFVITMQRLPLAAVESRLHLMS
jgi:two-component system sensor histidine kinase PilS (NtrC family)